MARRQNVRDRIGMAVYEKKKLNKKLVTMQKSSVLCTIKLKRLQMFRK